MDERGFEMDIATDLAKADSALTEQSKQSVLVVEPDELARMIAGEIATEAGFEVHFASCCNTAVAHFSNRGAVDVLLVAANLPEMPGHELAALLAKDFPRLRYIFLVAGGAKYNHQPMLRQPFTLQDLEHTLKMLGALPEDAVT